MTSNSVGEDVIRLNETRVSLKINKAGFLVDGEPPIYFVVSD
jgi:hypothetical protein